MIEKKRATASDLKKVDEYVLRREDYDDIPELTDEDFALHSGRKLQATRHLLHFRRSGRGWQSRINAALRKVAKLPEKKRNKA